MASNRLPAVSPSVPRRRLLLGAAAGVLAATLALALAGGGAAHATAREPLKVVATFSILGDMVKEVGGERVAVMTLVGANSDAHRFEPTPGDARALREAGVLVLNGLDFEAWLPRLVQAVGFKGLQVLASDGVAVRRLGGPAAAGDVDPHAWQNLANGMIYARNIAAGLSRADPRNAHYYEGRAANYVARMKTLDGEIRTAIAAIPPERRRVITSHDAFGYFGDAYGIEFIAVAGLSGQAEPTAQDVAGIVAMARDSGVGAVFIEHMGDPLLARRIASESGAVMGGTLYADALSPSDQPASTYLGMLSWNAGRLVYVLQRAAR